jgi:hypothetical protein
MPLQDLLERFPGTTDNGIRVATWNGCTSNVLSCGSSLGNRPHKKASMEGSSTSKTR